MNESMSLLELFKLGGVFMWPLLAFSIISLAIICERFLYLGIKDLRVKDMKEGILKQLQAGGIEAAVAWTNTLKARRSAKSIFLAILHTAKLGEHRMEKAAEAEAAERIRDLESGFNFLTALAGIAPLTGFLGTVSGMIGAFRSIAQADEVNAQLVANGIYEALITTVFGLIIAIVALSAFNILSHMVDTFAAHVDKTATDVITTLTISSEIDGDEK